MRVVHQRWQGWRGARPASVHCGAPQSPSAGEGAALAPTGIGASGAAGGAHRGAPCGAPRAMRRRPRMCSGRIAFSGSPSRQTQQPPNALVLHPAGASAAVVVSSACRAAAAPRSDAATRVYQAGTWLRQTPTTLRAGGKNFSLGRPPHLSTIVHAAFTRPQA